MKSNFFLYGIVIIILVCCNNRKSINDNAVIYTQILSSTFDSLKTRYDFRNKILTLLPLENDRVKSTSIDRLIELLRSEEGFSKANLELLAELRTNANDSLVIDAKEIALPDPTLYFYESNDLLNDSKFAGTFSLSNVVVDHEGKLGTFYLAINCGNHCSAGFVFFIRKGANRWTITELYQIWDS